MVRLIRRVPTRFVGMTMSFSRYNRKWCLRYVYISKPDFFRKNLHRNKAAHSLWSYGSGIDIVGRKRVVALKLFLLVGTGAYKRFFTCHDKLSGKLAKAHFESAKWLLSFEEEETEKRFWGWYLITVCWKHVSGNHIRTLAGQDNELREICFFSWIGIRN